MTISIKCHVLYLNRFSQFSTTKGMKIWIQILYVWRQGGFKLQGHIKKSAVRVMYFKETSLCSFQAPYFHYWTLLEKLWITLALYLLILSETSHPSSSQLSSNWPTLTNRKQSCSFHTWTYDLCDPTSVSSLINIQSQLKLLTLDFDFRYAGWPPGLSPAGPWPPAPPIQPTTV